jgi:hypothetical protein
MVHPLPARAWLVHHYQVILLIIILILGSPNIDRLHTLQQRIVPPGTLWIVIADNYPRPRPAPNITASASTKKMTTMIQTRSGRGSTAMSRELDEIRLLNKKHHQQEQQRKEEEEKRKKDNKATMVLEDVAVTTADVPVAFQEDKEDEGSKLHGGCA